MDRFTLSDSIALHDIFGAGSHPDTVHHGDSHLHLDRMEDFEMKIDSALTGSSSIVSVGEYGSDETMLDKVQKAGSCVSSFLSPYTVPEPRDVYESHAAMDDIAAQFDLTVTALVDSEKSGKILYFEEGLRYLDSPVSSSRLADKESSNNGVTSDGGKASHKNERVRPMYPPSDWSSFCHICSRNIARHRAAKCSNNRKAGTCRKVICMRCVEQNGEDFESAEAIRDTWECFHCRQRCPLNAQCFTYTRTNQRLRKQRKIEKARRIERAGRAKSKRATGTTEERKQREKSVSAGSREERYQTSTISLLSQKQ